MPAKPPKGWMSDEERALEALQRRRAPSQPSVADDSGVPQFEQDEVTKPVELVDLDRYNQDPAYREECDLVSQTYEQNVAFRALWNRVSRAKRDSEGTLKKIGNHAIEGASNASLASRLDKIETANGIAKWVLGFVLAATLGSMVVVFTKVFSWGESTGTIEIRLQHLERDISNHLRDHDSRRSSGWNNAPGASTMNSTQPKVTP